MSTPPTLEPLSTLEPLVIDNDGLIALGINLSNTWRLKLEAEGRFPRRIAIGGDRKTGYVYAEIKAHVARCAAARDASHEIRRDVVRRGQKTRAAAERATA